MSTFRGRENCASICSIKGKDLQIAWQWQHWRSHLPPSLLTQWHGTIDAWPAFFGTRFFLNVLQHYLESCLCLTHRLSAELLLHERDDQNDIDQSSVREPLCYWFYDIRKRCGVHQKRFAFQAKKWPLFFPYVRENLWFALSSEKMDAKTPEQKREKQFLGHKSTRTTSGWVMSDQFTAS